MKKVVFFRLLIISLFPFQTIYSIPSKANVLLQNGKDGATYFSEVEQELQSLLRNSNTSLNTDAQEHGIQEGVESVLAGLESSMFTQLGGIQFDNMSMKPVSKSHQGLYQITKKAVSFSRYLIPLILVIMVFRDVVHTKKEDTERHKGMFIFRYGLLGGLFFLQPILSALLFEVHGYITHAVTQGFTHVGVEQEALRYLSQYEDMVYKAIEVTSEKERDTSFFMGAIDNFIEKICASLYFMFVQGLLALYEFVSFFIAIFSKVLVMLCIVLFPVALALSFLPGFGNSAFKLGRYYLNFSFWVPIAYIIKSFANKMAFGDQIAKLQGVIDVSELDFGQKVGTLINFLDFNTVLALLLMTAFLIMVPKIADMLLYGGGNSGLFSIASGIGAGLLAAKWLKRSNSSSREEDTNFSNSTTSSSNMASGQKLLQEHKGIDGMTKLLNQSKQTL